MKASRWHLATLTLIIIFAAFLRLRHLEYSEIWDDQALVLNIAQGWVSRGIFPLVADKSSFGLMNPPLVEYLYALPLFIQRDILGVAWLTALANLAALLIAYWAVAKVFGPRVALSATLLYAVNPWSVHYSRLILNPTLVPLFAALLLASLLQYFAREPKPIYLSLSLLWLAGVIQTHWTSVVLVLTVGAIFLIFRRRLRLGPLLVGMALFLLSFTPYLVYEVIAGYPNLAALREGLSQPATISLASVLVVLDLLRTEGVFFTLGPFAYPWRASGAPWMQLDQLMVILLLSSLIYAIGWIAKQARTELRGDDPSPLRVGRIILLLWMIVPILFFL
ncbi:MAG: glycosyltransferase family 39 protein, partial [Chloroflexi bacterium]|nr:glycosyltransferase family 39 protein [Chloroflexota bacterium]